VSYTTWLEIQRTDGIDKRRVREDGMVGVATGACPGCKATPFRLKGGRVETMDDRTIRSGCRCVDCGDAVGYVYHRPATLFGIEEDQRVLNGRCRVY
jgi:hypothetical protein